MIISYTHFTVSNLFKMFKKKKSTNRSPIFPIINKITRDVCSYLIKFTIVIASTRPCIQVNYVNVGGYVFQNINL